ncbi:MAG: hypothetical protein KDC44_02185 [Phaeodactylibacter sp.]|nr:hypothetical protein [Phaeodactylibacter sp.]
MNDPLVWHGHANGKLLLSAEYFVLDGAVAIGLPCKLGQSLRVTEGPEAGRLSWTSQAVDGTVWFECELEAGDFAIRQSTDEETALRLQGVFRAIRQLQPELTFSPQGLHFNTRLEFDRSWGLGTSSTLLYLLSQWAKVDPFALLPRTFGGSGYDIAAAAMNQPFYYRTGEPPEYWPSDFQPPFKDQLYFVYLGRKQNSRDGIARYRSRKKKQLKELVLEISKLSINLPKATDLLTFEAVIQAHESMVASVVDLERVQTRYFSDYWGQTKSLGAWGGDFILVTSDRTSAETRAYFNEKGYEVFLKYEDLILDNPL